jgi:hypothetical protein
MNIDPTFYNPAWDDTAYDYYRLHQSQLQQSELNFAAHDLGLAKPCPTQIKEQTSCTVQDHSQLEKTAVFNPIALQETLSKAPMQTQTGLELPINTSMQSITQKDTNVLTTASINMKVLNTNTAVLKAQKAYTLNQATTTAWNKHHLFIEEGDAELSLNMHELPAPAQKQLIQFIKNSLKQQGLKLKSLIINGVNP